jgi:hypothetical protein
MAGQTYAPCLLAPWSLGILALSFRDSCSASGPSARTPGFIACASATAGIVLYSALCLLQYTLGRLPLDPANVSRITSSFALYAPLMIAGAWLSLALDSRWRPEATWVGWSGPVLGIVWLSVYLFGLVMTHILI